MRVKFAHLSDVHLGAWRNENLNQIGFKAFITAIDTLLKENVDFVIISGDLYDVSNPKVDVIDIATKKLKELIDHGIPVYGIMGSHDFSPSYKSMIRPLISAGLFIDVSRGELSEDGNKLFLKFVEDAKSKIKLNGLRARKRSLEIDDYRKLDLKSLEDEPGVKITSEGCWTRCIGGEPRVNPVLSTNSALTPPTSRRLLHISNRATEWSTPP